MTVTEFINKLSGSNHQIQVRSCLSLECYKRVYYTTTLVSVCGHIRISSGGLAVHKIGAVSFLKKEKTKAVCGLGSTNYGALQNVTSPIIDLLISLVRYETICHGQF